MGKIIQQAFDRIMSDFGLAQRMGVSMKAGIPSARAAEIPDSPENLRKLESAIRDVTGKSMKLS